MSPTHTTTADTIILDRREPQRNSAVDRAAQHPLGLIGEWPDGDDYDRELLKLHARSTIFVAAAVSLLVLLLALTGSIAGLGRPAAIWAIVTVTCYGGLALFARHVDATPSDTLGIGRARFGFLAGHFISGLGWTCIAVFQCNGCAIGAFPVVSAVPLLAAMAATAVFAASLPGALLATFAVPVAAYAVLGANLSQPAETATTALLVVALPFLYYVSSRIGRTSQVLLALRAEKDGLISELAAAKTVSDEARHRAEEANLAKSRFLASMSHELRTPLNAILGFSEVMANEVLGPLPNDVYRDYAGDIHASGKHLLQLINEILDLSRIEAGQYQLNAEPLSLVHIVEDCCHMMTLKARGKDIRLLEQFEKAMPDLIADERAVRQIALNLLSNAVKFTPQGGEILVRAGWTAGGGQYLSVRDTGPGIAEDEMPVVLSAFGQGTVGVKSTEQGTGLGLPIVQGLVALHGGSFDIRTDLDEGTEVLVTFPATRVMDEPPAMPVGRTVSGGRR